jgi:transcriptional regulator with XRE-family HTH domain
VYRVTLGESIRAMRTAAGLSIKDAAAAAGLPAETWSRIESGVREPHVPTLAKIAAVLATTPARLLGEEDDERVQTSDERVLLLLFRQAKPEARRRIVPMVASIAAELEPSQPFSPAMNRTDAAARVLQPA